MNQKKKIENYQQIAMGTGLRYDEVGGLVDKLVERTDGIAAKYSNLWK